ncbi:MAG: hypothetical protein AAF518_13125 [Spirochaetota bacterium]
MRFLYLLVGFSFLTALTAEKRICSTQQIPYGYVVISTANSINCPHWHPHTKNVLVVEKARNSLVVCAVSPIPLGYRAGKPLNRMNCPNWSVGRYNSYILRRVAQRR